MDIVLAFMKQVSDTVTWVGERIFGKQTEQMTG